MDKEAFAKLPKWKRDNKKKDLSDCLSPIRIFLFYNSHGLSQCISV